MLTSSLIHRVGKSLRAIRPWDYKFALYVVTLTTLLNTLRVAYSLGYSAAEDNSGQLQISGADPVLAINLKVGAALLVSAAGLWSRRAAGFIISMLALLYIEAEYVWWYLDSKRALSDLGMAGWADFQDPQFPYVGTLRGASWWSILLLTVSSVIFIWQAKTLVADLWTAHIHPRNSSSYN